MNVIELLYDQNYVFGIFNYGLLTVFYSAKEEHYFGWHVREVHTF